MFPISSYKIVVLLAGSLIIFYVSNLLNLKRSDFRLISLTPLSILFILFLLWSAFGYLYSADPEKSLLITIQSLGAILLYLGLALYIEKESQIKNILKILLCFGGILALLGILQQFPLAILKNPIKYTTNNSTSLFVHKNVFSGYLVFLIPLACLTFLHACSKLWKVISGISFILILIALGFSGSRGGQLVAIFSLPIITGYLISKNDRKRAKFLGVGILISIVLFLIIDPIAKILQSQFNESYVDARGSLVYLTKGGWTGSSWAQRVLFWQGGWEIFKDYWLIGSGPISFGLLFPKYYLDFNPIIENQVVTGGAPPHAHNLFIQTASDSGIIGIGLMLAFLIIFYMRAYNLFRQSGLEFRSTVFFFVLSTTCFLVHHMIEYNWYGPMFIYHFTFFIFTIDFIYRQNFKEKKENSLNLDGLISFLFGVILVPLTLLSSVQYYKFNTILYEEFVSETNPQKLTSLVESAKQYCTRCDTPHMQMALKLLERYKVNSDKNFLVLAKKELLKGQKINPYNPEYKGYLAQIYSAEEDNASALPLLKEALRFKKTHHIKILWLGGLFPQKN
jgi:O-antigen ligase